MKALRILLVIDYKLAYLGGAQTALRQQAMALAGAGHDVTVIGSDATSDPVLAETGVSTVDLRPLLTVPVVDLPIFVNSAAMRTRLAGLLDRRRVEIVIAHSEFGLAAAALEVAGDRGIPTMHTVHTFFWRGPRLAGVVAPLASALHAAVTGLPVPRGELAERRLDSSLRKMTLAVSRRADLVVSPSHHQGHALRRAGLPRVAVISNATRIPAEHAVLPPLDGPLRLVWAARLAPEKRLNVALQAMQIVEATMGTGAVHLDVAGGTPRSGPQARSVTLHDRVTPEEIVALLGNAHAAVITSHGFDNQPMIAIEAFQAGRPVIVSDPTLAAEFGAAAIATRTPDAPGLARMIIRLATHSEQLLEHVRAATAAGLASSPECHVAQLEAAYKRLNQNRTGSVLAARRSA
ncbi:Glycogen synthase [Frondihabitans sp. 762G35]|uniref:glycosyltransferase family 4 protein n=1 Tax=Frondihabitans sp. 762G35 TaxID=1446794 RepID=UPI000D218BAD|nr:glycosyltransferase family 4 protein [Frondihabitans sp. 762G35]ARC56163.1 Glycogen synthase [Frondihabitans sp. 762G35]